VKKKEENFLSLGNNKFLAVIIAAVSFAVYSNTIGNGYNVDDELIYDNHVFTESKDQRSTLYRIFTEPYYKDAVGNKYEYRPVVVTTFYFEFMLFGRNPKVSHAINVILFTLTCVLLFQFLQSLFRDYKFTLTLSFMIALLFAVHPLHTEAVASIKSRDELLSLLFGLLSWQCALRFIDQKNIVFYFLYLAAFAAALFSKQSTITFSILIPSAIIIFRKISVGRLAALALPITLFSAYFSPVYLLYKKAVLFVAVNIFLALVYYLISRRSEMRQFISGMYAKITSSVLGFFRAHYKALSIVPAVLLLIAVAGYFVVKRNDNLSEKLKQAQWNVTDRIHDFNELQVTPALQTAAPSIVPIAGRRLNFVEVPLLYVDDASEKIATSIYALGMYVRLMAVPYPLSFYYGYKQVPITGFGNFLVWLSLTAHLSMFVGMLYLFFRKIHYPAAFGLLFYLVSIIPLSNIITPIAGVIGERLSYTASLGFCIAVCYLIFHYHARSGTEFMSLKSPASKIFLVLILLFSALTFARNFNWKDHLTLMRHDIAHLDKSSRAHHLFASHLAFRASEKRQPNLPENKKMLQEAEIHFKKAIEIYPDFPFVWYDLAKTYMLLGENNKGMEAYRTSIKKDSLFASPCFELGVITEQAGNAKEAENAYKLAIQRDSLFLQAYTNLSFLYFKQGRYIESIGVNQLALKHIPNSYEALVNIGRTYLKMEDVNNALFYLEKAVVINRSDKSMLGMMADLFENMGNVEKAQYYRNLR